ncbi:hypothetical protein BD779DRAFT_1673659 [Infundibulicybe gibba]|nr:hypothetical protein BD779DRAFT_1673659 [Infundibulicybe gibba]
MVLLPQRAFTAALPLELQEDIIDRHGASKPMLAICSLVCKHWRLRSHYHTFATIRLTQHSVHGFHFLMKDPFSRSAVFPRVRHLYLGPPTPSLSWERPQLIDLYAILAYLSKLGNTETLAFGNLRWIMLGAEVLTLIYSGFQKIQCLELSNIRFSTPLEFTDFIRAFPFLRRIVMQDVTYPEHPQTVPSLPPCPIPPGQYGLSLCSGFKDQRLKKHLRWTRIQGLEPLNPNELAELGSQISAINDDVSSLLRALGPSLHHLELSSQSLYTLSDTGLHTLNLSDLPHLTHLSLGSSARVLSLLSWIVVLLEQIPKSTRPALRVLRIAFASSRQFHLDIPFLRCLAEVLTRPQFGRLQVIHFVAFNDFVDQELELTVERVVGDILSAWAQQGILKFTFVR